MTHPKKILVAPLNWGLGHASRCIPLIQKLEENCFEVHLASDGLSYDLLKMTFPHLTIHELPGYDIEYSESGIVNQLFFKLPDLVKNVSHEYMTVQGLHYSHNYSGVISDNRPGVRINGVHSVYMTHQLQFKAGWSSWFLKKGHSYFYKNFNDIWIPDVPGMQNLSGVLSNGNENAKYLGILSKGTKIESEKEIDLLAILSGPEPHRSNLEKKIIDQVRDLNIKVTLVRGTKVELSNLSEDINIINIASPDDLDDLVSKAEVLLCRSGYSTLMDLAVWKSRCILVPTPGQPEQEYLAKHCEDNSWALIKTENELNLDEDIHLAKEFSFDEKYETNWKSIFSPFLE